MYFRRRWYILCRCIKRHKRETCVLAVALTVFFVIYLLVDIWRTSMRTLPLNNSTCAPIDVVYTWVNGSDPEFIAEVLRYDVNYDPARYDDKNELLYSLRSLERFAPWVRHVFIVTNGQIPHWLDMSYEKVTVVPHNTLAPQPTKQLPTFSSAAIETFLHHIPELSPRFLYMNDDIFLGEALYPEDLYTQSEGVHIYQAAWLVPDCADDCPWTYIGDGVCDHHCNIPSCQHDGGDCESKPGDHINAQMPVEAVASAATPESAQTETHQGYFKKFITQTRNSTTLHELRRIVETYNSRLQQKRKKPHKISEARPNNTGALTQLIGPTVPATTSPKSIKSMKNIKSQLLDESSYKSTPKDVYSHSLIYTNMLLNHHYGFKPRNVLAHVGFLLQRDIMEDMQTKFAAEVAATARQVFRAPHDLQLAFAYYNFVMAETRVRKVEEIFDEFDTDSSGTWSDSEVRTFLARMFPLPLDWSALHFFEEVIFNCTQQSHIEQLNLKPNIVTSAYERYEDSNLPLITRNLVTRCEPLVEALHTNFAVRPRYKYRILPKRHQANNFMMLTSNVTEVVEALDKLRRTPRKFNCINDNLNAKLNEDNALIRQLLEDFYRSLFPHNSKFELKAEYRNRFAYVHDYKRWLRRKRVELFIGYSASLILAILVLRLLCIHKVKFARRYIQNL